MNAMMTTQTLKRRTLTLWVTSAEFEMWKLRGQDAQVQLAADILGMSLTGLRLRLQRDDADLRVRRATSLFFVRLSPTAEA